MRMCGAAFDCSAALATVDVLALGPTAPATLPLTALLPTVPPAAASALSPARVRKDHWKGMSPGQLGAIQATQLQQVVEGRSRKEAEKAWEQQYDR